MRVTVLGSGTSHGVPMIGCECPVCTSPDPRNRRFRPSIAVENDGHTILVDATPELRMQALAFGLKRVDAVLITHTHADHIFGLDDMRRFNDLSGGEIPLHADEPSLAEIQRIFPYMFRPVTQVGGGLPRVSLHAVRDDFEMFGMRIRSFYVLHGKLPVLAYRFNDFAYVTDTNHIPPDSMEKLRGLDTLILDAVRYEPHVTHFGLWEAVEVIRELKPRRAFLTHLSHHFDHEKTIAELPENIRLAHDGLVLEFTLP
jgi:phosphoribosyl 1,2-cyclic phosphate phosphodiesterase